MQCYNADKTCIIQERDIHVDGLKLKIVKYVIKIKI